ncbi:hypothetical protein PPERSA_09759 [Pseudocohnilembus persalinus]|uniref:Uncharacterized protein n=1 Tax=Pseudocohnilembus persalinus TaxID=266149 RepID=A0A0V0QTA8_PSEPJ|nr:hypothetical protein PPERSA_09759 [Pseudocohnilembus persalinus]|eukprot:KRX05619.1 hypothetical protein PPERSA_09759 [Pseudocohnilembus persalinus]
MTNINDEESKLDQQNKQGLKMIKEHSLSQNEFLRRKSTMDTINNEHITTPIFQTQQNKQKQHLDSGFSNISYDTLKNFNNKSFINPELTNCLVQRKMSCFENSYSQNIQQKNYSKQNNKNNSDSQIKLEKSQSIKSNDVNNNNNLFTENKPQYELLDENKKTQFDSNQIQKYNQSLPVNQNILYPQQKQQQQLYQQYQLEQKTQDLFWQNQLEKKLSQQNNNFNSITQLNQFNSKQMSNQKNTSEFCNQDNKFNFNQKLQKQLNDIQISQSEIKDSNMQQNQIIIQSVKTNQGKDIEIEEKISFQGDDVDNINTIQRQLLCDNICKKQQNINKDNSPAILQQYKNQKINFTNSPKILKNEDENQSNYTLQHLNNSSKQRQPRKRSSQGEIYLLKKNQKLDDVYKRHGRNLYPYFGLHFIQDLKCNKDFQNDIVTIFKHLEQNKDSQLQKQKLEDYLKIKSLKQQIYLQSENIKDESEELSSSQNEQVNILQSKNEQRTLNTLEVNSIAEEIKNYCQNHKQNKNQQYESNQIIKLSQNTLSSCENIIENDMNQNKINKEGIDIEIQKKQKTDSKKILDINHISSQNEKNDLHQNIGQQEQDIQEVKENFDNKKNNSPNQCIKQVLKWTEGRKLKTKKEIESLIMERNTVLNYVILIWFLKYLIKNMDNTKDSHNNKIRSTHLQRITAFTQRNGTLKAVQDIAIAMVLWSFSSYVADDFTHSILGFIIHSIFVYKEYRKEKRNMVERKQHKMNFATFNQIQIALSDKKNYSFILAIIVQVLFTLSNFEEGINFYQLIPNTLNTVVFLYQFNNYIVYDYTLTDQPHKIE